MMNVQKINWFLHSGGPNNNPYVQAWLDKATSLGYTKPSAAQIAKLNTFAEAMASFLPSLDFLYIARFGSAQMATINFVNPETFPATIDNAPTWTDDLGFTFNGTNQALRGYAPSTQAVQFALNSGSIFTDNYNGSIGSNIPIFGGSAGGGIIAIRPNVGGTLYRGEINEAGTNFTNISDATHTGFYGIHRLDASNMKLSRNSTANSSGAIASSSIPTGNIYVMGGAAGLGFAPSIQSISMMGAYLFASRGSIYSAYQALIT